ncbi:MAG TPA: enoyl-CoA hydratase-related protein [Solirubrobacteraceae bacterium]|nr:enoyl-CoA hydratase-related protein [Solirubrobacteraceae bacterium]
MRSRNPRQLAEGSEQPINDPEQLGQLFAERASAGDLEGMLALYEHDATFVGPDGATAAGSAAIRERLAGLLELRPRITVLGGEVVTAGDVALISNRWRIELGGADEGAGYEGRSSEVARRRPGGGWSYVIDSPSLTGAESLAGRRHALESTGPGHAGTRPRASEFQGGVTVDGADPQVPAFEQLLFEQDGRVARVTLNRPARRNALSIQLSDELLAALELVGRSPTIRVLVIDGAGETFCAGDDITEMGSWGDANEIVRRVRGYQRMADTLADLDQVTIAAVDGYAVGGGLEITMACDFVIATERAKWGMPEVDVGITPGWGGTTRMTRLIGRRMTKEINLLGALHPSGRAVELGLWNRVVANDRLRAETGALVELVLSKNQQALRQLKLIIDKGAEADLHTAQGFEALSAGLSGAVNGAWQVSDADQAAGVLSFIGKAELWQERRALARDFWVDRSVATGGQAS